MSSIFTKILNQEISGYILAENEQFFAILNIYPIQPGHILVIPKQEIDYIFDLDDGLYSELFLFAKKIAKVLQKVTQAKKIALKVEGMEVPHVHIHLIPINTDQDFNAKSYQASQQELEEIKQKIKKTL